MRKTNLDSIAEIVGERNALKLSSSIIPDNGNNRWLYVPRKACPSNLIARCIGMECLEKLCHEMGGIQLTIEGPKQYKRRKAVRLMLTEPRKSIADIAKESGYSRQYIYCLVA